MFELKNVSKFYQSNGMVSSALHNVDLTLSKGEIVAITGESGSGKSTLLNVITKMDSFDEGEIYYYGNETSYFSIADMDHFRKNNVGFIFQNYNIIDSYTVLENVMLPLELKGMKRKEAKQKALELIDEVGLAGRVKHRGTKLSGGEKQRCVIARALASDCEILACDEPTGNLDAATAKEIIELIQRVGKDKLVLIVTHDFEQVANIVTRKIKMLDGQIVEDKKIVSFPLEEASELSFNEVRQSRKISFLLAKNNLLFTPKKTLLVAAVLFVICFFILFLFQSIYSENASLSLGGTDPYQVENKFLITDKKKKPLDSSSVETLSKNVLYNRFYELKEIECKGISVFDSFHAYYEPCPDQIVLDKGKMPSAENEFALLVPANYYGIDEKSIGKTYELISDDYVKNRDLYGYRIQLTGYQKRSDVFSPIIIGNSIVESYARFLSVNKYLKATVCYDSNENDGKKLKTIAFQTCFGTGKSKLVVPKSFTNVHYQTKELFIGDYVFDIEKSFPIEYGEDVAEPYFVYGLEGEPLMDTYYEAYVYGKPKKLSSAIEKMNLDSHHFATYTTVSKAEIFLMNLSTYALIVLSSFVIIIIYFISYVILARIYHSRKKDYTILRTLGVTKQDMKSVVLYEVMIQTVILSVIIFLLCFILGKAIPDKLSMFRKFSVFVSIFYFLVIFFFGYIIARRFNRKLFQFSVNQTFKSEVK